MKCYFIEAIRSLLEQDVTRCELRSAEIVVTPAVHEI